jgi:hypothetical protein
MSLYKGVDYVFIASLPEKTKKVIHREVPLMCNANANPKV